MFHPSSDLTLWDVHVGTVVLNTLLNARSLPQRPQACQEGHIPPVNEELILDDIVRATAAISNTIAHTSWLADDDIGTLAPILQAITTNCIVRMLCREMPPSCCVCQESDNSWVSRKDTVFTCKGKWSLSCSRSGMSRYKSCFSIPSINLKLNTQPSLPIL